MKNLLNKEFRLAMHPTNWMFLGLSLMLLIPNYPYYVTFFYTGLGLFFVCLSGRENQDINYMMLLPIRKRDIVAARFTFFTIIELMQILVSIPVMILRNSFGTVNEAGMDANIALIGLVLIMLSVFNYFFLCRYYKNPDKVGSSFAIAATATFIFIGIAEACNFIVPFFRNFLDTKDPLFLPQKLAVLGIGVVVFALVTFAAYKRSVKSFEVLDL